jgi:hypothetical protein
VKRELEGQAAEMGNLISSQILQPAYILKSAVDNKCRYSHFLELPEWLNYPGLEVWRFLNLAIFVTSGHPFPAQQNQRGARNST